MELVCNVFVSSTVSSRFPNSTLILLLTSDNSQIVGLHCCDVFPFVENHVQDQFFVMKIMWLFGLKIRDNERDVKFFYARNVISSKFPEKALDVCA